VIVIVILIVIVIVIVIPRAQGAVTWPGCIVRDTDEWCVPGRKVLISPVCKEMQGMVGYAGLVGHLKSRVRAGEWSVRFPQVQGTAIKECFIKVRINHQVSDAVAEPTKFTSSD
jgi:hypothetical protein